MVSRVRVSFWDIFFCAHLLTLVFLGTYCGIIYCLFNTVHYAVTVIIATQHLCLTADAIWLNVKLCLFS